MRPRDTGPGVALAITAGVATDLRFSVEEREISAWQPALDAWQQYGYVVAALLGAGAVTFAFLHLRGHYQLLFTRRDRDRRD